MSLLITNEEVDSRVQKCEIIYKRLGRGNKEKGYKRKNGTYDRVPAFLKELMGGEVRAGRKATDVAKDYGVSPRSVLNFSEGRRNQLELKGSDAALDTGAERVADGIRKELIDSAVSKLFRALGGIDLGEKYNKESVVNQSVVTRNLSSVLEKLENPNRNGGLNGNQLNVQFVVHTPAERKLSEFGEPIRVIEKTGDQNK